MEKAKITDLMPLPPGSRLQISQTAPGVMLISIPKEGFSRKGLFVFGIIFFWLLMILAWTLLLFQYGAAWTLLSIPFWLLGLITLRISSREIFSSQCVEIDSKTIIIRKKSGKREASAVLMKKDISAVSHVEGSYKTLAGITRKGIYPALISNNEAFGIGERCRNVDKQWLKETLMQLI